MPQTRAVPRRWSHLATLLPMLMLATACEKKPGTEVAISLATSTRACARVIVQSDSLIHGLTTPTIQALQRNGICTYSMPEYNDEQELSDGPKGYGPIARAFAIATGRQYKDHTSFDNGWVFLAAVNVDAGTLPKDYARLNLVTGLNCYYVRHRHLFAPGASLYAWWEIAIGPADATKLCGNGTATIVDKATEQPSHIADEYPVAARFMEGPGRMPQLGVRCGDVWCVAGAKGKSEIQKPPFAGLPGEGKSSRWLVKGWFDDQELGVIQGTVLTPMVHLAIVPNDKLGDYKVGDFSTPREVATVLVPKGLQLHKYGELERVQGYGFAEGTNTLYLWTYTKPDGALGWKAGIVNANYPTPPGHEYRKDVFREDHSTDGIEIDPTARWHWVDTDEEVWVRCDVGCCLVYGDQ